jgi:hypothetical protein
MKINYNFELNDWMAFQEFHLSESKQFKKTKLITTLTVPIVYGLFILNDAIKGELDLIPTSIFTVISILWMIYYPKRLTIRTLKKVKKILEDPSNSKIFGIHTIELSEQGLKITKPESENFINWNGLIRIAETKNYYFIYNSTISAIVIPKVKIEENLSDFDSYLTKYFQN